MSTTGNEIRDAMLRQAIEAHGTDLDVLKAALPSDFFGEDRAEDQAEIDLMVAHMNTANPPGHEAVAEQFSGGDNGTAEGPADTSPADDTPMSIDEANAVLNDWQHKMHLARNALCDATMEQKQTRSKLVEAIEFFLRGNPMTREALIREHLASEAAERAKNGGRRGRAPSHGPSVVDIGRAGHGHSANRRYGAVRRGLLPGQRAYSLNDAIARSGSGVVDTGGKAPIPAVKSE